MTDVTPEPTELGGYRTSDEFVFRSAEGEAGILEGRMLPYNVWARIDSFVEGRFYETFKPRSLSKHLNEKASQVRVLFQHGMDFLGRQPIASFEGFRDEDDGVHYTARLFPSVPELVMDGLRNGQYGSSVRHKPVKQDIVSRPEKSERNPEGWQERSVTESRIQEFSVVTFPAFEGATAGIRSITDELYTAHALQHPEVLLQHIRAQAEPPHSGPATDEEAPPVEEGSRDTPLKPKKDWLSDEEEVRPWHLP